MVTGGRFGRGALRFGLEQSFNFFLSGPTSIGTVSHIVDNLGQMRYAEAI